MLLPRLCWQLSQGTGQARPELLCTAGLAGRSWCLPSLCHPGSQASLQELEAAQQAQEGHQRIPVFIHFPQITHTNVQFYTRPQLPCTQLCPEQNAKISSAKMLSWNTATQTKTRLTVEELRH